MSARSAVRELFSLRWVRVVAWLALVVLGLRLSTEPVLRLVLDRLAAARDLTCTFGDLDLEVFEGRGRITQLVVAPRGTEHSDELPLVTIEYAVFDLELLALLRGDLRIARAEVDGLVAHWVREADGSWNAERHVQVAELLALLERRQPPEDDLEPANEPIDLSPPLAIDALRLQQARVRIVDRTLEPALEFELGLDAALSDLRIPGRAARFSLTLGARGLVESARVEGSALWSAERLHLTAWAEGAGLRLGPLEPYLAPFDLRPASDALEARCELALELDVVGAARDTLRGSLRLGDVSLLADGEESLALDELAILLDAWSPRGAVLPAIEFSGVRGRVVVEPDSNVLVAGMQVTGNGWEEPATDWLSRLVPELSSLPAWAALLVHHSDSAYPWRVGALSLRDGSLEFEDRRVDPPARVPLQIERIAFEELVHDLDHVEARVPVHVALRAPGLVEHITLEGHLDPFAPARHVDLTLALDGIALEGIDGYLRRAGLERDVGDGSFELSLSGDAETDADGRTLGRLEVRGVSLSERRDLFGVQRIAAEGLLLDPTRRLLRVGQLSVEGPHLSLGRDPSQRFFAFGLRTLGFSAEALEAQPAERTQPPDPDALAAIPAAPRTPLRLELERVVWSGTQVSLIDELREGAAPLEVQELGFELEGLVLDGDPLAAPPAPARLRGRLAAAGLVEAIELEGHVQPRPGALDLELALDLRGRGLRGERLAPYLRPLGLEPALENGTFEVGLLARLAQAAGGAWSAALELNDLRLADGERTLATLERLSAEDLQLGEVTRVGALTLTGARVDLGRDADGALRLPGLRLTGVPRDASAPAAETPDVGRPGYLPQLEWPSLPALEVLRLAVRDAQVEWHDASLDPPLATGLALDLEGRALDTRGGAGSFEARLSIPDTLGQLTAQGELSVGPDRAALSLALEARELGAGPLTRLLPAGITLDPGLDSVRVSVALEARPIGEGGLALRAGARDLALAVHDSDEPWLAFERAALAVELEPASDALRVAEAGLHGLALDVRRGADGALYALGLCIAPATSAGAVELETLDRDAASTPAPPRALPRIALEGDISLELARARFHDERLGPDAPPFEGALDLRLATPAVLVSPRSDEATPLAWELAGGLTDVLARLQVEGSLDLFAEEPSFDVRVAARGLRTAGLVERLPALAERVRGTVERGTFDAHLSGALALRRASPSDLGFTRPFSAELQLADVAYRDAPEGALLAGVERVAAELRSVDLARGLVHVSELEIERPAARIARRSDGALHALGLALALDAPLAPPESSAPGDAVPTRPSAVPVEATADRAPDAPRARGELRIDHVLVSGIDVVLDDEAVDPPLHLPLVELDADLSGFTTRLVDEPRSARFDVVLGAGAGHANSEVPVFEELALTGRLALHPQPNAWVQVGLSGLTLTEFAGLPAEHGLVVEGGVLDAGTRVRLQGGEELRVDTSLVFADLALSEPAGGWLERTLSLPVALDTALFLTRNPDGEHRFSTGVTLDAEGISAGQLASAVARAFSEVLVGAVAGAPLRLIGAVVPLGQNASAPAESWTIEFADGSTELEHAAGAALEQAARYLETRPRMTAVLRCELSDGDAARAEQLANPTPEDCLALVARLRARRAELRSEHARLLAEERVERALGVAEVEHATRTLRAAAVERAQVERSLDALLEILRSDQPRRRQRRTRALLREVAELRLATVVEAFERDLDRDARGRIELRPVRTESVPELQRGRVVLELRRR